MSGEKGKKSGERFLTGNRVIYLFYIVYVIKNDRSLSHPIIIANKFLKTLSNVQYLYYHINKLHNEIKNRVRVLIMAII